MELARKAQEQALGLSEFDGLRKHSLQQIDQARAEARLWKAKFERVDVENMSTVLQYRQKVDALENALSAAVAIPSAAVAGTLGLRRFGARKLRADAVVRRKTTSYLLGRMA